MNDVEENTKKVTSETVKDDEVMISTSISDLEKMLEGVEKNTNSKFERFFLPSLIVFALLAFGGFWIVYSITTDMTKLAKAMDPKMGGNMSSMVLSVDKLSNNIEQMTASVVQMQSSFSNVEKDMSVVALKLNNLDSIAADLMQVSVKMNVLEPMLINMEEMNRNMATMQNSMHWMQRDLSILRSSFSKPLRFFNNIPVL